MTANRMTDVELDWLAFQYAAGELYGTELEQFERLLLDDERACAALAQAVSLGQAVVQCEQSCDAVVMPVRFSARRAWWQPVAVSCGAACVMLGLIWWKPSVQVNAPPASDSSQVASLWVEGAGEEFNGDGPAHDGVNLDHELDDDDAVPGWMLAAVSLQQQHADDNDVMND